MKYFAAALALIASTFTAQALDFTRISSERAFRDFVVGKVLVDEFGSVLVAGHNGSLTGKLDKAVISGGWAWRDGAFCRRLVVGQVDQGTDCQLIYIRANQVVLQPNLGYGNQLAYTIR